MKYVILLFFFLSSFQLLRAQDIYEDFESGEALLPWEPLNQQALLHGSFAVIPNPDPSGINNSVFVGQYTKGISAFSALATVAPGVIDITSRPQFNLDVWASAAGTVILQLENESQGNKEVERTIDAGAQWQTVSFDFSEYQFITDWVSLRLIFNPGVAEEGETFYFDNVNQSESTIDPCAGTVPLDHLIDDFECQRNHDILIGGEHLSVVGNPVINDANPSTSVGLYEDQPNDPWAALCYDFSESNDFSVFNQFNVQILSESEVPILIKLEGGSSPAFEAWTAVKTPGLWENITVDFSNQVGANHDRVCIFFNGGVSNTNVDTYYFDNVKFSHGPFTGCIMNFDDVAFISDSWEFFPADDSGEFELVDNPHPSGINISTKVGKAVEKSTGGQSWQGMYTDLPAPIHFGNDKIVKMKIWSPQIASVTMKIENGQTPGAPSSGDLTIANTKANEWEELTWDFSQTPITDNGEYIRVTLIWNINSIPATDVTYYFDDIQLTSGECGITGIGDGPEKTPELTISPNPVTDELRMDGLGRISRVDIFDLYGQQMTSVQTGTESSVSLMTSHLVPGTYILNGFSDDGELLAVSRFVKL